MFRKIKKIIPKRALFCAAFLPLIVCVLLVIFAFTRRYTIKKASLAPISSTTISKKDFEQIDSALNQLYPERLDILKPLPYIAPQKKLNINAESAILVNANTGDILYEKNAEQEIPPASMTKLFLMFDVFNKIKRKEVSLSDVIPIDERAYACNMMSESSLMFLGKDQIVTLEELLRGLAVSSGNDAAYAIAYALYGTMENFIQEVNAQIKSLGLTKTHIVESSGYSEENVTTAKEMASFARIYITSFPDSLNKFHSIKKNTFPQEHNIPKTQKGRAPQSFLNGIPEEIWTPITQNNTNSLLGKLEGCDGLKTGHIYESGYNICLTSTRNGVRYISVTMLGPGKNSIEGDTFRQSDGVTLHNYAFSSFYLFPSYPLEQVEFRIALYGAKQKSLILLPLYDTSFCAPFFSNQAKIIVKANIPSYAFGKITLGEKLGTLVIMQDNTILNEIPLVASCNTKEANALVRSIDTILCKIF